MTEEEKKAIEDLKHTLKISDELFEEVGDRLIDTRSSLQIETVLNLIQKQQEEIKELKAENHTLKEKLQMFIPRRRVRRVYKMIGKILKTDIDPVLLEKELKKED